ncbi:MAG: hypothetical protein H7Z41_13885 [Cytophagales bacterium]|nr:hypothetical protein [Armatimonadota bacterium]
MRYFFIVFHLALMFAPDTEPVAAKRNGDAAQNENGEKGPKMKSYFVLSGRRIAALTAIGAALTGPLLGQAAFAFQPPDGPPPMGGGGPEGQGGQGGFRGRGGPGGPGRPGGRRPFGGPRPVTVTSVPVEALTAGLGLTTNQAAKVTQIQRQLRQDQQKQMPRPEQRPDGPPNQETMQAMRETLRGLDQKAAAEIEVVLTSEQKSTLPTLIKALDALGRAEVPPGVFGQLKLTTDQVKQLAALPGGGPPPPPMGGGGERASRPSPSRMQQERRLTQEKVLRILTAGQKEIVEVYREANPRPQRGGREGFGQWDGGNGGPPPPIE